MNGSTGVLYRLSEWIMRFSVINFLWFLLSFPVFYLIGVEVFIWKFNAETLSSFFIMLSIVTPFTFFPATAAMFTVARKWITGDPDVPLFRTFFKGYKENYLKSMFGGLFYVLFTIVLYFNFNFYNHRQDTWHYTSMIFISIFVILFVSAFHFFSVLVHFHMKFWQVIKNALLIAVTYPFKSLAILFGNLFFLYVSTFYLKLFLYVFFTGSIISLFTFWQFHQIYKKNLDKLGDSTETTED